MNKLFISFFQIFVSLILQRYVQCKQCPTIQTSYIPMFDQGYCIRSFLKIPETNILVINAYLKTSEDSSIVYYSDLATANGDIINVVQPGYIIIEISYFYNQDKFLVMNYNRILIANPYTLKIEKYLSIPQLVHCITVGRTTYAIATQKKYAIHIISLDSLTIAKTLDNSKFPNVLNTQNYYSKFYERKFPSLPQIYLVITVNSYGFFSWIADLNIKEAQYNDYITPTIVNGTVSTDFANRQFTKHLTKDIFFVGAANLEILAFEIVNINTQEYRQLMKLNLYNSAYKFNVNNIVYKLSTKDSSKPLLIIGDWQYIYDLPLTFDDINKVITIPTYKNPSYISDKNFTSYTWYELPEDNIIVMSANYTVTLYNYYNHSYSYILYFGTDFQSRRFLYEENGQSFFAALNFKDKDKTAGSLYYYKRNNITEIIGQSQKLPYQTYNEVNNIYRVKNCKECLITKVAENTTTNNFMTLTYMYPMKNLSYSLNITSLGFKWNEVNLNLDPFYYNNQIWVAFGFRNKTADKKYLFKMINMQNITQNFNLSGITNEENSRKSSFALAAIDDPDNLEIIGVDLLGYIYVWDFLQPQVMKFSHRVTFNKNCTNSEIGALYQKNKKKWLILACDDMSLQIYDFQKNITTRVVKEIYSSGVIVDLFYLQSYPLSIKTFPDAGIMAVGDTNAGCVFVCKFNETDSLFYLFLTIKPTSYQDRVLSIEFLKDNTIWVQYFYSNLFYSLGDCLDNLNDCLSCSQTYNFKINQIYDSLNYYGNGTEVRPYTTSYSFLNAIMYVQRYQERIYGVIEININIIVDPQFRLNLPEEYLKFDFSSIISLKIKSQIQNQYALLEYPDILEFQQYNQIEFQDLKIRYYFIKKPNVCGLSFQNITKNVILNNIQLFNYTLTDHELNCFQIYSHLSNITIQNLSLQNEDFSKHNYIISTLDVKWIKIQNLSLDNCILGDSFSIVRQSSNLVATMKNINIINNRCIQKISGSVSPLFYAGLFKVENMQISNNNFCNKFIFSSVPTIEHINYQFSFQQIRLLNNTFITQTPYLFFHSFYSMRDKPSHSAIFLQMTIQNNTLLQRYLQNDLTQASLIQTSKIQIHTFEEIIFKNHHEITFSSIEYSDYVQVTKFNCINDQEYLFQTPESNSGRCLQLYEILQTKIQAIRVKYKKAYNYELISLQNKIFNSFSEFEIVDGEFSKLKLKQEIRNIYANPITIYGQNDLNVTFSNCHFFDNSLNVTEYTQTFSTTAIWIQNSLGTVQILNSTFKNSKSNSIYNFIFIETDQLYLKNIDFERSSFDSDQTQQFGGFMNIVINQLKVLNSFFSKSKSMFGSFIYIKSQESLLKINITNTKFSEGYAELDGGALYIDIGKSQLSFNCRDCFFDKIYTNSSRSSAIGFYKYRITNNSIIHEMRIVGGYIRNIFGFEDNFFTDIFNMKLSFINIKEIKSLIPTSQESETNMTQQFGKMTTQQSSFVNSIYSEIDIHGCNIVEKKILNMYSKQPLLISSEFTNVNISNTTIQDGIFVKSAIIILNGTLSLKNTQFINIVQKKNRRQLQVKDESTQTDVSSLIVMKDSSLIISERTSFFGTKCYNNCTGAVFYLMNTNFNISEMSIYNSESKYGGSIYIQGLKLKNIIISSIFKNNIAQINGGAIYLQALKNDVFSFRIENCKILQNYALEKGGAMFIRSNSQNSEIQLVEIYDSELIGNIAQIGGGINEKEISSKIYGNTIFKENIGKIFGNDTLSYPTHLRFSSMDQFFSLFQVEKVGNSHIFIKNFRSGDTLSHISFELVNDQDETIIPTSTQEEIDYSVQVKISKNQYHDSYSMRRNKSAFFVNSTKQFIFSDLDFIGIPGSQATLEFTSDQIYVLDKSKINQYHQDYYFYLTINLRDCIQGEAILKYNNLTECIICQEGKYSFDLQECHMCPTGATCAGGAQMVTNAGYWRKTNESNEVQSCQYQENCPGGSFGDHVCFEGHIGALCEECDITGKYWNSSYSKVKNNSCTRCDKIAHNSWFLIFQTIWILITIAFAIRGHTQVKIQLSEIHAIKQKEKINNMQQSSFNGQSQGSQVNHQYSFKNVQAKNQNENTLKIKDIVKKLSEKILQTNVIKKPQKKGSEEEERGGIYIKILTNYFQIISFILSFNLQIPSNVLILPSSVGQPLTYTMKSLDCLLNNYQTQIPYIFMRILFSMFIPFTYFAIFLLIFSIRKVIYRKSRFPWYILSTTAMYIIIYVQPDLVAQMIVLVSCRQIGDTKYILGNVSYECYTDIHQKYSLQLITPLLIVWVLILPLILFLFVYMNKDNLNKIKIKLKYGFLYKEYTNKSFYWEFIKMMKKLSIILIVKFYSTHTVAQAALVCIIILLYGILTNKLQPYKEQSINTLDMYSTIVCVFTVLLQLLIYQTSYWLYSSSFIIIVVINFWFILLMLKRIINIYIKALKKIFYTALTKLSLKIPKLKKYLQSTEGKKEINPIVKKNAKRVFHNYLSMANEEKQKVKINILKQNFKQNLQSMFGVLDESRQSCNNSKSMKNIKNFNLFCSREEQNNLLQSNQNFSPLIRPIYNIEDHIIYNDEENQKRRALVRLSDNHDFKFDEIIDNHLSNRKYEVETQIDQGDCSSPSSFNSKGINLLFSLNNFKTCEGLIQINSEQSNYLASPRSSLISLPFVRTYSEQIKLQNEQDENQFQNALGRFFGQDDCILESQDQKQNDNDTKPSKNDQENRDNYHSKEMDFLQNELINLDQSLDDSMYDEPQMGESQIKQIPNDEQYPVEQQTGVLQILSPQIIDKQSEQQHKELQIQESKQEKKGIIDKGIIDKELIEELKVEILNKKSQQNNESEDTLYDQEFNLVNE